MLTANWGKLPESELTVRTSMAARREPVVDDLCLSTRVLNAVLNLYQNENPSRNRRRVTISWLRGHSRLQLLHTPNFGRGGVQEIEEALERQGLKLRSDDDD